MARLRSIALLLTLIALLLGAAEAATRFVVEGASRIQRRIGDEHRAAVAVRRATEGPGQILIVGTSLLLSDLDMESLQAALAPGWRCTRFAVEQTAYYDWYYGMRRLFREGTRPDVVGLVLTPQQMTMSEFRGDYFGHYLMNADDVVALAHDAHLHPTIASSLLLARFSRFWGFRAEMRKVLLGRVVPGFSELAVGLTNKAAPSLADDEVFSMTISRLAAFRRLVESHGARFVMIVPAVPEPGDGAGGLIRAGLRTGVPVLAPLRSGTMDASDYEDGFHMNQAGARLFTERLIAALEPVLRADPK